MWRNPRTARQMTFSNSLCPSSDKNANVCRRRISVVEKQRNHSNGQLSNYKLALVHCSSELVRSDTKTPFKLGLDKQGMF
jgi:hypothetical protein